MHSVMINIAMEAEAAPFIEHLGLTLDEMFFPSEAPFLAYTGNHRHAKVTVITNGKDSVYGTGLDNEWWLCPQGGGGWRRLLDRGGCLSPSTHPHSRL
jgi:hypothetical protein